MNSDRHARQGLPSFHLRPAGGAARPRRKVLRTVAWVTLATALLLLAGLARSLLARWDEDHLLAARAADSARLHVRVTRPATNLEDARLTLPGTLQAVLEAQIYARANGYVRGWRKDIGAPVRAGEVLAELDLPEVQRQVEEAQANEELARVAFERWTRLRAQDAVSQQELDEKTGAYRQSEAVLHRLREQLGFGVVVAPFDGTVIRRNINVGDLVNAGSGGSAQSLFTVAQTGRLHTYVYVPQDRAARVRPGDEALILLADRPGQPIHARVARTAGAIDLATRTLQIDIEVANADHALLPGAFVEVQLALPASGSLLLPTNALLFGAAGTEVARVREGRIERHAVTLGTDYGRQVEVRSGLVPGDAVVLNPPDSVASGQEVVVEAAPAAAGAPAGGAR